MLAEPRRKQRISIDPQNLGWKNSDNMGKRLLKKMGWSDGKGIGRNEQGTAENLAIKPNHTNAGLGAEKKTLEREHWISHHDDFASLLEQLNQGKTPSQEQSQDEQPLSIEAHSRSVKRRIHYKFTKGKDLSMASDEQKSAIFGYKKTKKRKAVEPVEEAEDKNKTEDNGLFSASSRSASDYYAEKMKKWGKYLGKKEETRQTDAQHEETVVERSEAKEEKTKKKRKQKKTAVEDETVQSEKVAKKKKKKNKSTD